jgi:protocatechuate 3,4-dioxygenase, alpha subunit
MTHLPLTASQTVGPFFHDCLMREDARCDVLCTPTTEGTRIRVEGRVIDGDGEPVPDAVLEVWQANAHGRYAHPADRRDLPLDRTFTGYGRIATDPDGRYAFTTVKPGAVPYDAERQQAPHISIAVLGRGLLNHLYCRLYFDDEPANAVDPLLERLPADRRDTLVACRDDDSSGDAITYRFDVVLQGANETVFLDLVTRRRT